MPYYPVFLDLNGQKIVVVGGGEVAERKIEGLLTHGCTIYITAPHLTSFLQELVADKKVHRIPYDCLETVLNDAFMVIAATDDLHVNSRIASQAKERGLLVNAVDQPKDCNFIVPSRVKRGDLQIAISTAGKSPALAKKIRKRIETIFGPEYGLVTELLGLIRARLLSQGHPSPENKIIFQKLVDSKLLELIKNEDWSEVENELRSILGTNFPAHDVVGKVVREV